MLTIIWFFAWWFHGFPYLLSEWNPWNIALIVCVALDSIWGASKAS